MNLKKISKMKKTFFIVIVLIMTVKISVQAQKCDLEMEKERKIKESLREILLTETVTEAFTDDAYMCQISLVSDEIFHFLCSVYHPNFEKEREKNPNITNYFMFAENENGELNMFCEHVDLKKELANFPQDVQKRLDIIEKTIKMNKDVIEALDKEKKNNYMQVLDNGIELIIKHATTIQIVPIGKVSAPETVVNLVKDKLLESKKNEIMKYQKLKNENKDAANEAITLIESCASLTPATKIMINTNPYWLAAKSTPEVGDATAMLAANVNIYFRQKSYEKVIEDLEKEKQSILKK